MARKYYGGSQDLLELDTRRKVYETVRRFAGCHFREIERKSGMPSGTVKYHLSQLVRYGLVREEKRDANVRYVPSSLDTRYEPLLGLLRQRSIRAVLLYIVQNPGCNQEQIARAANLAPSTTSYHLKKLEELGMVRSTREGRYVTYALRVPREDVLNVLTMYQESFFDAVVARVIETWQ